MPFGIGVWKLMILSVVLLLVFGPERLTEPGRQLGNGMRELKASISGGEDVDDATLWVPSGLPPGDATATAIQPEIGH